MNNCGQKLDLALISGWIRLRWPVSCGEQDAFAYSLNYQTTSQLRSLPGHGGEQRA
jgi:hypothetical protein